jgi:acid phosphatase type 7
MRCAKILTLCLLAALPLAACTNKASTLRGQERSPYLQSVGPDTATVAFRLPSPCEASVRYGPRGQSTQEVSSPSALAHAVALTGLSPGTTYQVAACGQATPPRHFSTAPAPGSGRVRLTAVGDFGMGNEVQRAVAKAMLAREPQLFLGLGDVAYGRGTEKELQENLFVPMAELLTQVPLFAALGNHEYLTQQGQPYLDNLLLPRSPSGGERYYRFTWGPVDFFALDSSCVIGMASPERCSPATQAQWLEQELARSRAPWKVAFFHHPPWSSGAHGSEDAVRLLFAPLFERYGVDLVLTGHDHHYERTVPMRGEGPAPEGTQGVTYVVVGTGGAALRPFRGERPAWSAVRNDQAYGFLEMEVEADTLTARMLTPEGQVLDTFTLRRPAAAAPARTP